MQKQVEYSTIIRRLLDAKRKETEIHKRDFRENSGNLSHKHSSLVTCARTAYVHYYTRYSNTSATISNISRILFLPFFTSFATLCHVGE